MSDQDDFDQNLTPSQEYCIAFIVILLFGAMYWFFTQGSQSSAPTIIQPNGATQSHYISSSNTPLSSADEASFKGKQSLLNSDLNEGSAKKAVTQNVDHQQNNDIERVGVEKSSSEHLVSDKGTQSLQATNDNNNKLKAEAAALAAATSEQQIADEARFNAKQLELKAGIAELVIPPKPNDASPVKRPDSAPKNTESKQFNNTSSPTINKPRANAFVLSDELARVDFKLPDGRTIQIPKQGFESQFKQSILKDEEKQTIVFDRVSFFPGSDLLNPESSNQILGVAGILNTYKDIKIKLRGHTDSTGPAEENLALSFKRSLNLKKQLVGLGINTQRIQVEGLGASEPISDNGSEKGRNKNRRIDLTIIR